WICAALTLRMKRSPVTSLRVPAMVMLIRRITYGTVLPGLMKEKSTFQDPTHADEYYSSPTLHQTRSLLFFEISLEPTTKLWSGTALHGVTRSPGAPWLKTSTKVSPRPMKQAVTKLSSRFQTAVLPRSPGGHGTGRRGLPRQTRPSATTLNGEVWRLTS